MVKSIDTVLAQIALEGCRSLYYCRDSNQPRVEVPNLIDLKTLYTQERNNWYHSNRSCFYIRQTFA
jgi:hypothetical protein